MNLNARLRDRPHGAHMADTFSTILDRASCLSGTVTSSRRRLLRSRILKEVPQGVVQAATVPMMVWTQGLQNLVSSMLAIKTCQWSMSHMAVTLGSMVQGTAEAYRTHFKLKKVKAEHAKCQDRENALAARLDEGIKIGKETIEGSDGETKVLEEAERTDVILWVLKTLEQGQDLDLIKRICTRKKDRREMTSNEDSEPNQDAKPVLKERGNHPV
ncbi:50S ribosomal protein L21 [Striga asiatica]|uniref:50S ribosomal protein L21 n=1 Tax=Striga asiatica TaxID=4170 RepID=A0A5A7P5V2_STRAF|nr:50S ribosomal protein L21 [Striga asiatica]